MTDVHDPKVRSYNMSRVSGKNTGPEVIVRKYLFNKGFRYRLHDKALPGKPDIVLRKYNTVVFINGCFWHGHKGCKFFKIPQTRTEWWRQKINANKKRDQEYTASLEDLGWQVLVVWECELKKNLIEITLKRLEGNIRSQRKSSLQNRSG
jgi:DNA mismatch endonuclease, patch repair protein